MVRHEQAIPVDRRDAGDAMLTLPDVQSLVRDLESTKVLSVYVETRVTDPAMRDAWRPALTNALREIGANLPEGERAEFERARETLKQAVPPPDGVRGAKGWIAFADRSGIRHASHVPASCPTLAAWRDGPLVAPSMRVLKGHRAVIIAMVDSRSARVYRYAWGVLDELPDAAQTLADAPAPGEPRPPERRGANQTGPRSRTGTEKEDRRESAAFDRLAGALAKQLDALAGDDGWIVFGGTREHALKAAAALPARLADRWTVPNGLDIDAGDDELIAAARLAAKSLRETQGTALIDELVDQGGEHGRSAMGLAATQRALLANAVDVLVMSSGFLTREAEQAEATVRGTLLHGGGVDVLPHDAGTRLDEIAGGVAARLRFAVP
jgi:hypothetical protein